MNIMSTCNILQFKNAHDLFKNWNTVKNQHKKTIKTDNVLNIFKCYNILGQFNLKLKLTI